MIIIPIYDALVTPILHSEKQANEVKARSGILIQPPKNTRMDFEGIPNEGKIYALPASYDGMLKVGDTVYYNMESPKGYEVEGVKFFAVPLDKIAGVMNELSESS